MSCHLLVYLGYARAAVRERQVLNELALRFFSVVPQTYRTAIHDMSNPPSSPPRLPGPLSYCNKEARGGGGY